MNQELSKAERINSKITIENIFKNGDSVFSFPYKVIWIESTNDDAPLVEILISVGKKRFKNAVDRNQIKRLIKESFRLNKNMLWDFCDQKQLKLQLALVYVGKEINTFETHNKSMIKIMNKIIDKTSNS
ncbi:MAG: ribonuclease P protein component [Bacteroidales bacterium]|nr:ribonuclease P protein component [Bacteroidales bacterium]